MVKKPTGAAKATATSADATAQPSKANPSTPGSLKARPSKANPSTPGSLKARPSKANPSTPGSVKGTKFKKLKAKAKANPQKPAVTAAAAGEVALVGAGTGDGGASASAVLPQPSDVAEASPVVKTQPPNAAETSPVVQTPKSSNVAEASPVVQTQPSNAAETSPVVQTPKSSNVAEASPVVQTQPSDVAEASPVVQTPKSTTFAEASPVAQTQKPATDAEGSVPATMPATAEPSASSPKPKPKPKPAHANADADADAAAAISASKAKGKGVGADNIGSDGRMKSRRRKGRGGKGKEVVEDGGSKGKEEGKKSVGKKEERGDRKIAGFIFMCNAKTKKECYQNRVFGMPSGKIEMVKKIRPGVKLFLYDFDLKLLYGVYKAASHGGLNLVQGAFNGKFSSQVKFKIDEDCRPLPESSLKQAIKENYSARSKFDPELTARQVQRLLSLFKPVSAPQSVPNNRRGERRHYEERRKPYHHFEERRPSLPIEELRQPLFDEERRPAVRHVPLEDPYRAPLFAPVQGDHHRYYQPPALAPEPRHIPLVLEPRYVPAAYYRTLAPSGDSYYQSVENLVPERYADRTVADVTTRDPIIRDHTALPGEASARAGRFDDLYRTRGAHVEELYRPGEISAHADRVGIATRADRVEELYRSDRPVNRAVDPPHSAYLSAAYDTNPAYAETGIRPVPARVSGPGAPVSSHYSFTGGPVYR